MRTGRPRNVIKRKLRTIGLTPIHDAVLNKIDFDPYTNKRVQGARDRRIEEALEEYFQKHHAVTYLQVLEDLQKEEKND